MHVEARVFHGPGMCQAVSASWLVSPSDIPVSTSLELGLQVCTATPGFVCGGGNGGPEGLNLAPYTSTANT